MPLFRAPARWLALARRTVVRARICLDEQQHPRTREYAISMPGGGPPPHANMLTCFGSEEQLQIFLDDLSYIAILTLSTLPLAVITEDPPNDYYLECTVEGDDAQMAAFGFWVFYSNTKKVFHKDLPTRGGTIGGRSLFRIFICMYL